MAAKPKKRKLPWYETGRQDGDWYVDMPHQGAVVLGCFEQADGTLTPASARAMAVALLMAADEADLQAAEISAARNAELARAEAEPAIPAWINNELRKRIVQSKFPAGG